MNQIMFSTLKSFNIGLDEKYGLVAQRCQMALAVVRLHSFTPDLEHEEKREEVQVMHRGNTQLVQGKVVLVTTLHLCSSAAEPFGKLAISTALCSVLVAPPNTLC